MILKWLTKANDDSLLAKQQVWILRDGEMMLKMTNQYLYDV